MNKFVWVIVIAVATVLSGYEARAAKEVDVSGTIWEISVEVKSVVKGVSTSTEDSVIQLFLGPLSGEGLAADEFKVATEGTEEFEGTYTAKKGHVSLTFEGDDLEEALADMVEDQLDELGGTVTGVSVSFTRIRTTAMVKPGESIKFDLKSQFTYEATIDGTPETGTGSFSVKGRGVPD